LLGTHSYERTRVSYEYEIFVSYRRTPTVGGWVRNHLVPRLEARLNEITPIPVRIFCDDKMAEGVNLPAELKRCIRGSALLLTVWSADYFRSAWCMAEWQSFRNREAMLGLFSDDQPNGIVYPVRYADGEHFHPEATLALCRKDFSQLNYPDDAFRLSAKYLDFDDLVKEMAKDLALRLPAIPPWSQEFPVVEPPPMPPPSLARPVL
jgi:hypothetical protein